jgi:hypothetical protein
MEVNEINGRGATLFVQRKREEEEGIQDGSGEGVGAPTPCALPTLSLCPYALHGYTTYSLLPLPRPKVSSGGAERREASPSERERARRV